MYLSIYQLNLTEDRDLFLIFQAPVPISYPCNVLLGEELMPLEHHCLEDISCTQGNLSRGNDKLKQRKIVPEIIFQVHLKVR